MAEAAGPNGTTGPAVPPAQATRLLVLMMVGQIALHAAMAGQRMAAPLQALDAGHSAWAVGVLLALFAALPVLIAMPAGRMADRHGYHRPQALAIGLSLFGVGCALLACAVPAAWSPWWALGLQCVGAASSGAGTNVGVIVVLRAAGLLASDSTGRLKVFSWLGMAFSGANVLGPVSAGVLIDLGGYALAYGVLLAMPLVSVWAMRQIPRLQQPAGSGRPAGAGPSRSWPRRGSSACSSSTGCSRPAGRAQLRGAGAGPCAGLQRLDHRPGAGHLHRGGDAGALRHPHPRAPAAGADGAEDRDGDDGRGVRGLPLCGTPWSMAACATLLGLALGAVQPMIMNTLHHLTPPERHGEAIAIRSMTINFSSSVMPLAFGAVGTALGPGALFWLMGAVVGGGSWALRGLKRVLQPQG